LLLSAWILVRGRRTASLIPLTLSALVKLITLPLVVLHLVGDARRRGLLHATALGAVVLGMAAATYAPFYRDPSLLITHAALLSRGGSALPEVLRPVAIALTAGFFLWLGWTTAPDPRSVFNMWGRALLVLGILFTVPSFPWYLICLIGAAAIAGSGWLVAVAIPVSLASFLVNARDYLLSPDFTTDAIFIPPRGVLVAGVVALALVAAARRFRYSIPTTR
jgi:hypothetical protein